MNLKQFDICDLIPQRPPMVMIDKLSDVQDNQAKGILKITENNIFLKNGFLQEAGMIEFMAQTAAAYTGYRKKVLKQSIKEGYIGALKNLIVYMLPEVGTEIESLIIVENEIIGYTIIKAKTFFNCNLLSECEIRILTP